MNYTFGKTPYPDINLLADEAERMYRWALDRGMPVLINGERLAQWAKLTLQHALEAEIAAQLYPELICEASKLEVGSVPNPSAEMTLPTQALLALEYLTLAASLMDHVQPRAAQVAIYQANGMLQWARKTMDELVRQHGQRKGGKGRGTEHKANILEEARDMLTRGLTRGNVAVRLSEKYGVPYNTVRDWLKKPKTE